MNKRVLRSVIALVAAAVLGLGFAIGNFTVACRRDFHAYATVELLYEGAANGLDPNGNVYSADRICSSEIVKAALDQLGWQDRFTVADVQKSLSVRGVYPENIVETVTDFDSALNYSGVRDLKINAYYTTAYDVSLYDTFAPDVRPADLQKLLDAILDAYRQSFLRDYSHHYVLTELDSLLSPEGHDYTHVISLLNTNLSMLQSCAEQLYALQPTFLWEGVSFKDLSLKCAALRENKLDKMNIGITMNGLTTDADALLSEYEYTLLSLNLDLTEKNETLTAVSDIVNAYERDATLYVNTGDSVSKIESTSGQTYDTLTAQKAALASDISVIRSRISDYEKRIEDIKTEAGSSLYASLESDLAYVSVQIREIQSLFDTLAEHYDEKYIYADCISVDDAKLSETSLLSGSFLVFCVKCVGPFGVLALAYILTDSLLTAAEKKRSSPLK